MHTGTDERSTEMAWVSTKVARGRGGIGARFGYNEMSDVEKHSALFWIAVLSMPLLDCQINFVRK
jgi:hypothetical protein